MAESSNRSGRESHTHDEIRTIGFRLREIQHLLALRVAQENRRLEAEGLEPVDHPSFADRMRKNTASYDPDRDPGESPTE